MADYTVFDGGRRQGAGARGAVCSSGGTVWRSGGASPDCIRYDSRLFRPAAQRRGGDGTSQEIDAAQHLRRDRGTALQRSGHAIPNDVLRVRTTRDQELVALAAARDMRAHASIVPRFADGYLRPHRSPDCAGLPACRRCPTETSRKSRSARRAAPGGVGGGSGPSRARRAISHFQTRTHFSFEGVDPPQNLQRPSGSVLRRAP